MHQFWNDDLLYLSVSWAAESRQGLGFSFCLPSSSLPPLSLLSPHTHHCCHWNWQHPALATQHTLGDIHAVIVVVIVYQWLVVMQGAEVYRWYLHTAAVSQQEWPCLAEKGITC